jgi:GntR family transcriptional regulator
MQFRETQPIYLQIAQHVCEKILLKEWKSGERIPSVRELAILLEVNPNTVMRTYEFLHQNDIINNERGIGFFVAEKGLKNALAYCKAEFIEKEMPYLFRNLVLLEMELNELTLAFEKYKRKNYPNIQKTRHENK